MIVQDLSFSLPQENIAYDEFLLANAQEGVSGEVLRFWESPVTFVVLGRISKVTDDLNIEAIKKDQIPVLRRCSGGGTVLQGRGCLNYSLILSKDNHPDIADLNKSYKYILEKVIVSLQKCGVEAEFKPISDLAIKNDQLKISGNAQKRSKDYILHHGTILYDFDLNLIGKYLKMPKSIPEYRSNRVHGDFVTNIEIDQKEFKDSFKKNFRCCDSTQTLNSDDLKLFRNYLQKQDINEGLTIYL